MSFTCAYGEGRGLNNREEKEEPPLAFSPLGERVVGGSGVCVRVVVVVVCGGWEWGGEVEREKRGRGGEKRKRTGEGNAIIMEAKKNHPNDWHE